ncbi:hypothetical protein FB451DRAFT_1550965 [Mycena latifolia]|nr:hypothetical protein FB451DRAFT_1550965 [Mycena latifolia]
MPQIAEPLTRLKGTTVLRYDPSPRPSTMCDVISAFQTSIVFGALSLVPGNTFRYIGLGLASASLTVYAVHHQGPSQKLARLEGTVKDTEEIMEQAKLDCLRNGVELMDRETRLLHVKLSVSKIKSQMLEARDTPWNEYFQKIIGIWQSIDKGEKDIKQIQTSTLLTIEGERQRRLSEGIKESREIFDAVVRSL